MLFCEFLVSISLFLRLMIFGSNVFLFAIFKYWFPTFLSTYIITVFQRITKVKAIHVEHCFKSPKWIFRTKSHFPYVWWYTKSGKKFYFEDLLEKMTPSNICNLLLRPAVSHAVSSPIPQHTPTRPRSLRWRLLMKMWLRTLRGRSGVGAGSGKENLDIV